MSQENVELVRRLIEAYQRADFPVVAAGLADDFEFTSAMTALEETSYRGRNSLEAYWADMNETWEGWRLEVVQVLAGPYDDVAVIMRLVGRGKSSGVPVNRMIGIAYRVRGEKLSSMRSYLDPDDALEAVGLSV